jgi:bifunctional DNA-binding transcriptional regulator/antitoxin component of YhaV-PrlF toxin-antitoxin module
MPLTELATFKAKLTRKYQVQVPRLVRWRYKMEPAELLKVNVAPYGSESYQEEMFLAKMARDGRLTVPKLTLEVLKLREEKDLAGTILEVTISPAGGSNDALPPESAETKMLDKIKDMRKNLGSNAFS